MVVYFYVIYFAEKKMKFEEKLMKDEDLPRLFVYADYSSMQMECLGAHHLGGSVVNGVHCTGSMILCDVW